MSLPLSSLVLFLLLPGRRMMRSNGEFVDYPLPRNENHSTHLGASGMVDHNSYVCPTYHGCFSITQYIAQTCFPSILYTIVFYSLAQRRGLEHPLGSLASPLCRGSGGSRRRSPFTSLAQGHGGRSSLRGVIAVMS